MDSSSSSSAASFTFVPPNPGINSHSNQPPTDLNSTLSSLKHLLRFSKSTLSAFLPIPPIPTPTSACLFNPNHRLPPSSLFHHHLTCPDSPSPIPLPSPPQHHLLSIPPTNPPTNPNDVVSISLNPTSPDPNFFYSDCPAVVTFPFRHDTTNNCMLTLPAVLFNECDNANANVFDMTDDMIICRLLASECYNLSLELTKWNHDFPGFYSFPVLRTIIISYSYVLGTEELKEWMLVNSPFYGGVVIDVFTRDHVFLLFRVCFRCIAREGAKYLVSVFKGDGSGGGGGGGSYRFECPVLVKVMTWLGGQLGVLYGDVNGKMFAVNMLKQALMIASSGSLFVDGDKREGESVVGSSEGKDGSGTGVVLVSQVAAAVAALRERAALETRIKGIRASRFVPAYQRMQEHGYISKMAEEERKKRSNYRPIIEHDGVLWHHGGNQDANKNKSREELLAEERDYKRRRMSYRGKKMKRSTTQVMRDIIDEYMQEIKHANMAGQPPVDATNLASEPSSTSDVHADGYENDQIIDKVRWSGRKPTSDISMTSERSEDEIHEKSDKHRHVGQHEEYFSKKTDGRRSSSRSHDHRQRDEHRHSRKSYLSNPDRGHSRSHDNRRRSEHKDKRSSSNVTIEFEDRYHPKSHDVDDDDGDLYSDS